MNAMTPTVRAALYARVSSDRQVEEGTIASQVEALRQRIQADGLGVDEELCFIDDGYSGATVIRPALERLRDQAANGAVDRLYVHSPDRLARHFGYQFLLLEELQSDGVQVIFLNRELGRSPEDDLLLQVQGVIAEYERAKICERSRRGKKHAAQLGRINVLSNAPYGYRYVLKSEGQGQARYEVVWAEAAVVRQMFSWVAQEQLSISDVCRRLQERGETTRSGRPWHPGTVANMLKNPAYKGTAGFGKTRHSAQRVRLRPLRGRPEVPRRPGSRTQVGAEPIFIPVPALVSEALFGAAAEQLAVNRQRHRGWQVRGRYLLQGLVVCAHCGYALGGMGRERCTRSGQRRRYAYYRCRGRQMSLDEGQRVCHSPPVHSGDLEQAVWKDVRGLLNDPGKIEEEYQRRLRGEESDKFTAGAASLAKGIAKVKRTIARLIDAYEDGLLDKGEFEVRLRRARARLGQLQSEAEAQAHEEAQRAELRLLIGKLQDFAEHVSAGLHRADDKTRQEIIRALVKRVEVSDTDVRIVYRVSPVQRVDGPEGGVLSDCRRRAHPA
jgi:site-specific DNA recombinase